MGHSQEFDQAAAACPNMKKNQSARHGDPHAAQLRGEERNKLVRHCIRPRSPDSSTGSLPPPSPPLRRAGQTTPAGLLVNDDATAATTSAISEQVVLKAMSRTPRRELDETIRRQGDAAASGLMIGDELDAVGELLVGVAQRDVVDGLRSAAVFQGGCELLPGVRVDSDGEHLGMQEPALPFLLPSHLDAAHHNRALEAGAVQAFAEHFTGARDVRVRQRVGREQAKVDRRDFMRPGVGVGQGMEFRNRALPI
jgi:hypothetical protein